MASAQDKFIGVWKQGNYGYSLIPEVDWSKFNTEYTRITNEGMRLTDIETYIKNGKRYYTSVWKTGSGKHACIPAIEWGPFNQEWTRLSGEGYRLIDIETYSEGGKRYYLSVWGAGTDRYALLPPLEWAAFDAEWRRLGQDNLRLVDIETYLENGKRYYLGVWRQGTDAHALLPPKEWAAFESEWKRISAEGMRLDDVETYTEGGKQYFLSTWRAGTGGYALWSGTDWQGFDSHWATEAQAGLRLTDIETFDSPCDDVCLNRVLSEYNYPIKRTSLHCEGRPGDCDGLGTLSVMYHWPSVPINGQNYIRFSALDIKDKIFTLPFKTSSSVMKGFFGWMYGENSWHEALDFYTGDDYQTFQVVAAAKGKVIHMDWDGWSGNTIVISHDVGARKDVYRTIYMHLRNGPDNDCALAWSKGVPAARAVSADKESGYKSYLNGCGCPENASSRNPTTQNWGTNSQKMDMSLLGKTVEAGDVIAYAGSTGPGGKNGNHLHIFFAHRDATDNHWYLFDPYGIYSYGGCYPDKVDGAINTQCVRYPVAWKNGKPGYAQ